MLIYILTALVAATLVLGYAQQKLYPHTSSVPLPWWALMLATSYGWWGMLEAKDTTSLPGTLAAVGKTLAQPVAMFQQAFENWLSLGFIAVGIVLAIMTIRQIAVAWPLGAVLSALALITATPGSTEWIFGAVMLPTQLYGWYYWGKHAAEISAKTGEANNFSWFGVKAPKPMTSAARLKHVSAFDIAFAVLLTLAGAYIYALWVKEPNVVGLGLGVSSGVVAQLLSARKHWFGWALWAISNLADISLAAHSGYAGGVLISGIMLMVSLIGLSIWHREAVDQQARHKLSEII